MTDEQRKKTEKRIMVLSIAILVLLIISLILIGVVGAVNTLLFPTVIAVFLAVYWVVSDVLSVRWLHSFEGKTDDQKKSYYIYAGLDVIGLGGLVYFMVDMKSTTGAIIYICCLFLKKRFRDEFNGVKKDEEEDNDEAAAVDAVEETAAESVAVAAEEMSAEPEAAAAAEGMVTEPVTDVTEEPAAESVTDATEENAAGTAEDIPGKI